MKDQTVFDPNKMDYPDLPDRAVLPDSERFRGLFSTKTRPSELRLFSSESQAFAERYKKWLAENHPEFKY